MKILLTGRPKSGKTTILKATVNNVQAKFGFVTEQILKDGQRIGFELVSVAGTRALLASVDSGSTIRVSKYGVDIRELDTFLDGLPGVKTNELIYVDEIGQMELYSEKFKKLINEYMRLPNPYIGTISSVYEDEFTKQILGRQDVVVLTVHTANRQAIQDVLESFVANLDSIISLDSSMTSKVTDMARSYASNENYLQVIKLFRNAVRYVVDGRITSSESGYYLVEGDHGPHNVRISKDIFTCDCKLFRGTGVYVGHKGECSHIQAVKLITA